MSGAALRLGTRGSKLALAQSREVADMVTRTIGRPVELVEIVTTGDRSNAPVARLGVGVFVSALRDALTAGEIDLAVHSYKDLPTAPAPGLVIAAVPEREDPRDVLVTRNGEKLAELPHGARIGTGAPRRIAQLLALGYGLVCEPIRGNIDTRLRRVLGGPGPGDEADLDAVVLARAGLRRIDRLDAVAEALDPMQVLPAPAQGALAVECREADTALAADLAALDHAPSRAAVTAERALLATLEAGCSAPVGGLAETTEDGELYLRGAVIALDGSGAVRLSGTGTLADAAEVGRRLAAELRAAGAESLMGSVHDDPRT